MRKTADEEIHRLFLNVGINVGINVGANVGLKYGYMRIIKKRRRFILRIIKVNDKMRV